MDTLQASADSPRLTIPQRTLSDEQVAAFDTEFVDDEKWEAFHCCIDNHIGTDDFRVLEVGGGNGVFADRILLEFPRATVTVLDLNESILARNAPHPRKRTLVGDALTLDRIRQRFDVVSINWVLHHLVGDTFGESITNIRKTLRDCRALLAPGGCVSIYDNLYDGLLWDRGPSRLIYAMTSIRTAWLASIMRSNGANTAGVGVCFQSQRAWFEHFKATGLRCVSYQAYTPFLRRARVNLVRALALHMRPARPAHFWLRP